MKQSPRTRVESCGSLGKSRPNDKADITSLKGTSQAATIPEHLRIVLALKANGPASIKEVRGIRVSVPRRDLSSLAKAPTALPTLGCLTVLMPSTRLVDVALRSAVQSLSLLRLRRLTTQTEQDGQQELARQRAASAYNAASRSQLLQANRLLTLSACT